jgi:hypothetical protein
MRIALRRCAAALVLTTASGTGAAAAPARAEVPISAAARMHFVAGVRLLTDPAGPRYEEAYQEFRVAYADSPSPHILGNAGLCAMKLERDEEAIRAYEKYLTSVPDLDPAERRQIESDLGTLRASLVRVSLQVDVSDVRIVDVRTPIQGAPITNVYGPYAAGSIQLGIHPGHHTISVRREGYVNATWELDGVPSASLTQSFALRKVGSERERAPMIEPPRPPPPPDRLARPTPPAFFALGGVTLALGAAGVATGVTSVIKRKDFDQINNGTMVADAQSLHDTGQRLNAATDALFATAIAAAVVTIVLYVTRPTVKVPASAASMIAPAPTQNCAAWSF